MSKVKVKLLTSRASKTFSQVRGEVVEVDVDEAARMVAKGQAEMVRSRQTETTKKVTKGEKADP